MLGFAKRYSVVVAILVFAPALRVSAVELSGIVVFSADAAGNPNGVGTFQLERFDAHAWHTLVEPRTIWHGLGVLPGSPAGSTNAEFLNADDFTLALPLERGEYELTFLAEPGPLTHADDFEGWVLNLYFDGNLAAPGISVLVPRYGDPGGNPPAANLAEPGYNVSFDLRLIDAPAPMEYDDGKSRVAVAAFSLLPPDLAAVTVDRVAAHDLGASGVDDFVGALTLRVERSSAGRSSDDGCAITPELSDSMLPIAGVLVLLVLRRRLHHNERKERRALSPGR